MHRRDVSDNDSEPLSENELSQLGSDELIAYIRKATDAGRPDRARTALAILCWRHFGMLARSIRVYSRARRPHRPGEGVTHCS